MSLGSASGPKHTYWKGPWHYCGQCYKKTKIATMKWQRGVLKCTSSSGNGVGCYDSWPLPGQREAAISAVLGDGKEELAPVEKLRNPLEQEAEDDFVL